MISKSVIVGALIGTLVVGLTGCVPVGEFSDGVTKLWQEPGGTATSETAAPIEGDENGDGDLSEFEKQILAQNALRDYAMPDGTTVQIDPNEPLPLVVKEALTKQAGPVVAPMTNNRDSSPETIGALTDSIRKWIESKADETGKKIVIVISKDDGTGNTVWGSLATGIRTTGVLGGFDRNKVVSDVQSWADRMGYELIVVG